MADTRTYIKVHDGMPDHPKIDGLSDAAFRLLVTTWCWCSRHLTDGHVPAATWKKRGTAKTRRELIDARLFEEAPGGVQMGVMVHDYLEHQRSAEEVQEIRAAKGKGGSVGNHVRWHVGRDQFDPDCIHCTDPERIANGSQNRSDVRSHVRSGIGSRKGNSHPSKRSLAGHDKHPDKTRSDPDPETLTSGDGKTGVAKPSHNRSQIDRKTSPVSVSETEEVLGGSVGESSAPSRRAKNDDDSKIDERIIELLAEHGGRVTPEWAAKVRRQILSGRDPRDPAAYVAAAIRGNPRDYLPTGETHPSSRSVSEAIAASMGDGP